MHTNKSASGNNQPLAPALPLLLMQIGPEPESPFWEQIKRDTGLEFKLRFHGMEAQPENPDQILKLLISVGGLKTRYCNDSYWNNVLMLKNDHHYGFDITSICYDCVKHNNLSQRGLEPGDRLAC
jgi:hypothetical protein